MVPRTLAMAGAALTCLAIMLTTAAATPDDPFLWLEDVSGERALDWVRERNEATRKLLDAEPAFAELRERSRAILDDKAKIPDVARRGKWLYNFWRDGDHARGLWRRTTWTEFQRPQPAWETVLDLDALAAAEKENWVWTGAECLGPEYRHCLLQLSRGGADAHVVREFDAVRKTFVEGGFALPEAKSEVAWLDADTVFVGTDTGAGSMTTSGYPRTVRRWRRGTLLAAAPVVFEARADDIAAQVMVDRTPGYERVVLMRAIDFYRSQLFLLGADDKPVELPKPEDADLAFWRGRVLLQPRSDGRLGTRDVVKGSLLVADADDFVAGRAAWQPLFVPTASRSLAGYTTTATTVVVEVMEDVASRLQEWRPEGDGWRRREVAVPRQGYAAVQALHDPLIAPDPLAEELLISYTDFLTPDSLLAGRTGSDERRALKTRPSYFDTEGMRVEQRFARSRDGTRVPYFVVWPRGAKSDGTNPTLLYGYGGFEESMQPWYSGVTGSAWLARGGVFAVANIRGGGEYGPAWHQAAVTQNRQRSFDDFIAVAEDLIASKVTTPARLGIEGGSNGGLLVGAVMLQRPELFGAVVCQVPLLDMKRYPRLLAGASWIGEYGDPDDPADWAAIAHYSPYQNLRPGMKLPPVLFTSSTRDDRVHPGHARKMVARMIAQGYAPLYYENIEGGHAGAADNAQLADVTALEFVFLWRTLGPGTR